MESKLDDVIRRLRGLENDVERVSADLRQYMSREVRDQQNVNEIESIVREMKEVVLETRKGVDAIQERLGPKH